MNNNAATIIVAFDRYFVLSIKDYKHILIGFNSKPYYIKGPEQVRPSDFTNELKNVEFKEALVRFLIDDWNNNHMAPFMNGKVLYINFDKCYKFETINNKVQRVEVANLSCPAHEEVDTKIIFHICNINVDANVTIRCSDTDVAIIMLGSMSKI